MTNNNQQADDEINEDQLLNFLVNVLTGAFGVSFGDNTDFEPEDISEVLVGATADGTSISPLCDRSNDSPSGTNILHHLRTKFDLETVSTVGNTLRQEHTLGLLPEEVEIVVDLHLRSYYGERDETDGLYDSEAKAGTTAFHAYATLDARVRNTRYTLAVRRLTDGDTPAEVLAEFLGLVDDFDFEVKALYVDSEFSDGNCLTLMQAHNHAYVVPIINWGNAIKKEFSEDWSREIEYDLTTEFDGHEWTVEFPVMIDCTYPSQMGRYDEHSVARHGSAADALIDTPRQARQHDSKRFGIEATYRLSESSLISTTATDQTRRLLFVVISLL